MPAPRIQRRLSPLGRISNSPGKRPHRDIQHRRKFLVLPLTGQIRYISFRNQIVSLNHYGAQLSYNQAVRYKPIKSTSSVGLLALIIRLAVAGG